MKTNTKLNGLRAYLAFVVATIVLTACTTSCKDDDNIIPDIPPVVEKTASDFDGNVYHLVTIGNQTVLVENFRGTHFANGDPIPRVADAETAKNCEGPAYSDYNNDPENGKVYGKLLNFLAATDPRGLLIGFHTPTEEEWKTLQTSLGGYMSAGIALMETGTAHWLNPARQGTNTSGMKVMPNGGYYLDSKTNKFAFQNMGQDAYFWTKTTISATDAIMVQINSDAVRKCMLSIGYYSPQNSYLGVRLFKS